MEPKLTPRHIYNRIEEERKQQSAPAPAAISYPGLYSIQPESEVKTCAEKKQKKSESPTPDTQHPYPAAIAHPVTASNAAPADVLPVAGSGPTDGEMLDWLEKNKPQIRPYEGATRDQLWAVYLNMKTYWGFTLRAAITSAMKEAK